MPFEIWDGSSFRAPTFVRRWNGSAWEDVGQVSRWDGSSWLQVWPNLAVSIANRAASSIALFPGGASASYALLNTGVAQLDGANISGEWLVSGAASAFEARVTVNSGTLTTGPVGIWVNLGTSRTWTLEQSGIGVNTANVTVEIRVAATGVVLDSATVTFYAEVSL